MLEDGDHGKNRRPHDWNRGFGNDRHEQTSNKNCKSTAWFINNLLPLQSP